MTLRSDEKFEKRLICGFKNDMRNLMNFNASSSNSENLRFDVLLLLIAYKMHLKKYRRIVSLDNGKRSKL